MSAEFTTIRSVGGLLPPDVLQRVVAGDADLGGLSPGDYGLPPNDRLGEAASRIWRKAQRYWSAFQAATQDLPESESGVTETRDQWLLPLLRDLGYRDVEYRAAAERVPSGPEERRYPISHRSGVVPIHLVSFRQDLDRASADVTGRHRLNPHALLQEYLNRANAIYGILSNGLRVRLLRDSASLTRQAYVEFDLQAMLEGGVYSDFLALYLVLQRSRLPRADLDASQCWLERWRERAETLGARALGELRGGVEAAIEALGTGFLAHPANAELERRLSRSELAAAGYYRQLLRLVYRLIFLFVAEERDLVFRPDSDPANKRRYLENYSASRLRSIATKYLTDDRHDDLWRTLQVTFDLVAGRRDGLDVPALGGGLFDNESCPDLDAALIRNDALAEAIRRLSWVRVNRVTRRVNYRDMDAEELGGIYEGLLERQPRIVSGEFHASFTLVKGGQRKQTGSYYTPTPLVQELIRSALDPVIADRRKGAKTLEEKKRALLGIAVCDPACGSGHFLLAAARRIAQEYARIEAGDAEPTPAQLRDALRRVIGHGIHGVDVNPLAVDLCKLALWLEGHDPGRPLSFLDHRIKLGNSLVGVRDLAVLEEGIPDGAYLAVTGDDKTVAAEYKKRNQTERLHHGTLDSLVADRERIAESSRAFEEMATTQDRTAADVRAIKELYAEYHAGGSTYWTYKVACDLWTAAFFAPLRLPEDGGLVPTTEIIRRALRHPHGIDQRLAGAAIALAQEHRFFHWPIEFAEVFERGGFDCVLGNPPWERIKLQEQEFFADRDEEIAKAPNKAARQKLINALAKSNPSLDAAFEKAKRAAECESKLVRESERFPLTAVGDVNLYALFAEQDRALTSDHGRAGIIVPTGIATDDSTKRFFQDLVSRRSLVSYFGFKNEQHLFPMPVEHTVTFGLLTLLGADLQAGRMEFTWLAYSTGHMNDPARRVVLTPQDLQLVNPNTRTCPVFRTAVDAELTKAIYRRVPVLVDERTGANPWGVEFLAMFHMSNDSHLFHDAPGPGLVPLYEAKLFHQFNHRWATYDGNNARDATQTEQTNPMWQVRPRYWIPSDEVDSRIASLWRPKWLVGFRRIARSTDERTLIVAIVGRAATGDPAMVLLPGKELDARSVSALVACLNSLVLDYVVRQKLGGTDLRNHYFRQFPVLPRSAFSPTDPDFIAPRVLELTYTAWDLQPFAQDLSYDGPPFRWDEERRAVLRAELDAYYAALYGLSRDELRYILDPSDVYGPDFPGETFRVLKEREIREYGEYRTRRLVLEAWDRLGLEPRNREGRYEVEPNPPQMSQAGHENGGKRSGRGKTVETPFPDHPGRQPVLPGMGPSQLAFGDLGVEE